MSSPDFPEPPAVVPPTPLDEVDALVERIAASKDAWVGVDIAERIALLRQTLSDAVSTAEEWVATACRAKGIPEGSPRAGEEWLGGPVTFVRNIRLMIETLEAGGQPTPPSTSTRPDGQHVVRVFPGSAVDKLMFTGITADVWIEPGQSPTQGRIYRDKAGDAAPEGRVALVLGAGNVASIGPMDALYKLFAEDEVVVLKTNPVNAYLGPFIDRAFRALADRGFFGVVHGGAAIGKHLCEHPRVDTIHITGSDQTHDAIVWGVDPEERAHRKASGDPQNTRPISSELGCVTPVFVVPGDWSASDIEFQARHVASMVANNGSFNCNAAKVLVTAAGWSQRERFVAAVHDALGAVPPRKAYYPGAQARYASFVEKYPTARPLGDGSDDVVPWTIIPDVTPSADEYALTTEAFCGVLAETALEADDAAEFLTAMVAFGNDTCWGTLSCMILVHPDTEKQHAAAFDAAIAALRYGGIAINAWAGLVYGLVVTPWGAHPGHTLEDIRSGRGVVHNTYLLDHVQKTVVRAPFRINPKPAWFADHKTQDQLGRSLLRFEETASLLRLPPVIWAAVRG